MIDQEAHRVLEILVFYGQACTLALYILICKIFKALKLKKNKQLDENDPFQLELDKSSEDFMAKENFFMDVICIQILNIGVSAFLPTFFSKNQKIS